MISLVAFDMGGVLLFADEQPAIQELARLSGKSDAQVFEACFSPERKRPHETGRQSWPEFANTAMADLGLDIPEQRFKEIFCSILVPNPPMFDLVERVSKKYRIALLSNTSPAHWERSRELMPFVDVFDPLIVSFEVGQMKPDHGIFDTLAGTSGMPHDQIFFTDDYLENVEAARSAGLQAAHFVGVDQLLADFERLGIEV